MKRYKDGLYITHGKSLIRICGGFGTVVFAHKKSNHKVGDNVYDPGLKFAPIIVSLTVNQNC